MSDRLPHNFSALFSKYETNLLVSLLLTVLFAGGCTPMPGIARGDGSNPPALSEKLPFPGVHHTGTAEPGLEPTVVSYPEYHDPLIWLNRGIFVFNDLTYHYLLIPLGKGYVKIVPAPVQGSVSNFFYNLKTPIYSVNHLVQLEPRPLGRTLLRFVINSTVGVLGLFDPARSWWGLEREETDFEATLAHYGAGYGIYLVLPLFGPSDLRNGSALVVDHFLNPIVYLTEDPERTAIQGFDFFQDYAPEADRYDILRRKSEDRYIFFRNLYLQGVQRDADY